MAKKPSQNPTLKTIIRVYLNEDCFIQSEPKENNYEFIFDVKYPKLQDESGNQKGRNVAIFKPKKRNYLEVLNRIIQSEENMKLIQELDEPRRSVINNEIKYYLISQKLLQTTHIEKNQLTFLDKLYFSDSDYPRINELYHSIIKVINSQIVVFDIINRHLGIQVSNKFNSESRESYFQ